MLFNRLGFRLGRWFGLRLNLDFNLRLGFGLGGLDVLGAQGLEVLGAALLFPGLAGGSLVRGALLGAGEGGVVLLVREYGDEDGALLENGELDALVERLEEAARVVEAQVGGGEAVVVEHGRGSVEGGLLADPELAGEKAVQV